MGGGGTSETEAKKKEEKKSILSKLFIDKTFYSKISSEFHPFHQHDLNVFLHLLTTGLGVWGAVQLARNFPPLDILIGIYGLAVVLTTPVKTGVLHTLMLIGLTYFPSSSSSSTPSIQVCIAAMISGYGLQDLSHYLTGEKTYMDSYIRTSPQTLLWHTLWLLPLVIDSIVQRTFFLPWLVSRKRNIQCVVHSKKAVDGLRQWVTDNVAETNETTHVWPHHQEGTTHHTVALENDEAIMDAYRKVFAAKHFDIKPIQGMNEIYVTAVGAKKQINSDAVFYTPHVDGPYWWLPGASCYRCLVALTPNTMVRTRFNLQYGPKEDSVLTTYDQLGFDYNRELHWIDHTDQKNTVRRSVLKLHYVVYPKGWESYGSFVASLNTMYNTWARGNFLKTLRPKSTYDYVLAWWIWLTTWSNAMFELYFGWNNLVYILSSYFFLGPMLFGSEYGFLIMTSFRHYVIYITTFGFREPTVAYGVFMRDAKLFKSCALLHLAYRMIPSYVSLPQDIPILCCIGCGFGITMLATYRIGFVRTYFGSELGLVEPKWIEGFPYGYIPHPMIVGQLFAFGLMLGWYWKEMDMFDVKLIMGHMVCYTVHMVQEMLYSSY